MDVVTIVSECMEITKTFSTVSFVSNLWISLINEIHI